VCEYSYGIYLTHVAALWLPFVVFAGLPVVVQVALFVGLTALLSYLAFTRVESPGIAAGKTAAARLFPVQPVHPGVFAARFVRTPTE